MMVSTPKSESTAKAPEPMDASVSEARVGTPATNRPRVCYALATFVAEVRDLFPEIPDPEYTDTDGRNTALGALWDLSAVSEDDRIDLAALLGLYKSGDRRVRGTTVDDEEQSAHILMWSNPRTQDDRTPFGTAGALSVLVGADETSDEAALDDDDEPVVDGGDATSEDTEVWDGGQA